MVMESCRVAMCSNACPVLDVRGACASDALAPHGSHKYVDLEMHERLSKLLSALRRGQNAKHFLEPVT